MRGCEPACVCWEWNAGPLQEQPVFLTEPSLQPRTSMFVAKHLLKHTAQTGAVHQSRLPWF